MNDFGHRIINSATRIARRHLVGPQQSWVFERPPQDWLPAPIASTSLYLHVPFCRHFCPYCPYTKLPYRAAQVEPYTRAAIAEVDWWADRIGPAELTSVYIGGGTPTLALESVARVLSHIRRRFHVTGDICIETNPADVDPGIIHCLQEMGVALVSLGVQSFHVKQLDLLGRGYQPDVAEQALSLLVHGGFASVNADIMFALPQQNTADIISDLQHAAELGADQLTTYPLFTFPYTSVGQYRKLQAVQMPDLRTRRTQYQAISRWCASHGFERISVWGFRRGRVPRYSSVTRDSYIGIGPGAGSDLGNEFALNSFDFQSWRDRAVSGERTVALRLPFTPELAGWWWLYWRLYDTVVPLDGLPVAFTRGAATARRWLKMLEITGLGERNGRLLLLSEPGAFWLHLAQNQFALNYVNKLWTQARQEPWPAAVEI